jgi:glutamyl-tRNA synthetase
MSSQDLRRHQPVIFILAGQEPPFSTGFLHAIMAGTYLLRIEDTDKVRSTDAAIAAIHDGLDWLGLSGDKPAISQSAQSERHQEVAHALIAAGAAYRCYLTDDELTAIREDSRKTGDAVRSPWR